MKPSESNSNGDNGEEETFTLEKLIDYISLGITEYIRDQGKNLTAKSLIEDSVEHLLKLPMDEYNNEQILENIEPLNFNLTQELYENLRQKIINRK